MTAANLKTTTKPSVILCPRFAMATVLDKDLEGTWIHRLNSAEYSLTSMFYVCW